MSTVHDFASRLQLDRPLVMGILNVTPDSFSDGGVHLDPFRAVAQAKAMIEQGAEILDLGAESTRPGSSPVTPEEQCSRLLPVFEGLRIAGLMVGRDFHLSVDTTSSQVAHFALERGAVLVNDVSAGLGDPSMFEVVANHDAHLVLMHMQGTPLTMQDAPTYLDVVAEVLEYLSNRCNAAEAAGISRDRLILDPGIGFGKTRAHNLELLRQLQAFTTHGFPVLLGCSRKRFMGALCDETEPSELLGATVATTALGVTQGVKIFRVHDVKPNRQAAEIAWHLSQNH
jgi:dihydropteroate synthase